MESNQEEGVDQSKRAARGYKGEEWADYPDVNEAAPKSLDGEDTGTGSEDLYEPEGLKSSSAQQAIVNKAKNAKAVDAEISALEKDAQSMAEKEPLKFKFTKSPSGDFSLSRTDLKKEAPAGTLDPRLKPQPAQASAALHGRDKSQMQGVGPAPTMMDPKRDPFKPIGEAPAGTLDPRLKPQSTQASAALHGKDKSQMQGVGPRPTMTDPKRDPFKPLGGDQMQEASPPSDKAEDFIRKNKDSFKKRYGARWKQALYGAAWEKFGKKK
jgi:hypothetical protein